MELYQLSKYQNIADRLKRLSSPPSIGSNDFKGQTIRQKSRMFQDRQGRKDICEQTWKGKYSQAAFSKYSTIEADKKPSTYAQIQNHLISPRRLRVSEKIEGITSSIKIESQIFVSGFENEGKTMRNDELFDRKKSLGRVKGEGGCKIDQILESFNNYKQNKEKFVSILNRRATIDSQGVNWTEANLQESKINGSKYPLQKQPFLEIDNIWNSTEQKSNSESGPRFERSFTRRQQVQAITDVLSTAAVMQPTERVKNFSKSKLILKNLVKQVDVQNSQSVALKTMVSPRGARMPGKICKNNDRTFTAFSRS